MEILLKLEEENKKLRKCVEWYADKENWTKHGSTAYIIPDKEDRELDTYNFIKYGGKIARDCLNALGRSL